MGYNQDSGFFVPLSLLRSDVDLVSILEEVISCLLRSIDENCMVHMGFPRLPIPL